MAGRGREGGGGRGRDDKWLLLVRPHLRARGRRSQSTEGGAALRRERTGEPSGQKCMRIVVARDEYRRTIGWKLSVDDATPLHDHPRRRVGWRVRRLPATHYESRSRIWRPCFPRPPRRRTSTRPGRTPAYAASRRMSQQSTDAWAQSPPRAR